MGIDVYKIRSSLSSDYKRDQLFRGTLLAVLGLIPIIFGGAFLPPNQLKFWGLPIFFIGGALIAWGLLPYRKLCRIEMKPNELHVDQSGMLTYFEDDKLIFSLKLGDIKKIEDAEVSGVYGMAIYLKESNKKSYDLFLPYFTKNSIESLKTFL